MLNLDANATYGWDSSTLSDCYPAERTFANPSAIHWGGQREKALMDDAREELLALVKAPPGYRVIFTSGATEANNQALVGTLLAAPSERPEIVVSSIEHPAILECQQLVTRVGGTMVMVAPRRGGSFDPADFMHACSPETILLSVMSVNNETGQIVPVSAISSLVKGKFPNVVVHADCVQVFGKLPFSLTDSGLDMISLSGHKFGGMPGVGALIIRDTLPIKPLLRGGPQQGRLRAGTENVVGICSLVASLRHVVHTTADRVARFAEMSQLFLALLDESGIGYALNFAHLPRVSNTLSIQFPGIRADDLVVALDLEGVWVSSGSACASGKPDASHVLLAMGLSEEEARSTIRISFPGYLTMTEVEQAAQKLIMCVTRLCPSRV